jgi:hypothetical protein
MDPQFARLYDEGLLEFIDRLQKLLGTSLARYTDLPSRDRLFVEDIDSFSKVRDINPAMIASSLKNGYLTAPRI